MDSLPLKINNKVVVRNLPSAMDENEFRILTQKFNSCITYFKYLKPSQKGQKSKCFIQLSSSEIMNDFIEEFNKPFFDCKGEQFVPSAELAFYQEISSSVPNNNDVYSSPAFAKFKEFYDSGNFLIDENQALESPLEKKSALLQAIKEEAEEDKKREENKKGKQKKWKNKGKKWVKK